ncbi:MAG: SAM-dependent methyltransferase [Propionibacteriales bacterium]|nr:SAM-dependent methyltransferase [Propionibacteriales bacterium]
MHIATLQALLSPGGRALLGQLEQEYDGGSALALSDRLRREHPAELVAAAMTQLDLRRRARDKFGADADVMMFTPDALEQATRRSVARHRAGRLRTHGVASLLDLGCGIGGDLLAAARAGIGVVGVERDPLRAELARVNLAALGLRGEVVAGDVVDQDRGGFDAVFADPARRDATRRVFDPEAYSPSWSFIRELQAGASCVKVAPGIPHDLLDDAIEAEWVSDGGELKEAALWSGRLAGVRRRATVLPSAATMTETDNPGGAVVGGPQAFVYEPDPAVIRAGLVTAVAALVGGTLLDPRIAYVTGPRRVDTPFARGYQVTDTLPFREKALRAALRERGIGVLTIKKRGVDITPEVLRKRLALHGDATATIIITRLSGKAAVLLVDPLPTR